MTIHPIDQALALILKVITRKYRLITPIISGLLIVSDLSNADLNLNQVPPKIRLSGDHGGRLNGTSWNSSELKGILHILMYVDPDKINVNEHVEDALSKEQYPLEAIRSVAITNLAATWKPKFIIEKILKRKQKKFPRTTYITDKSKVLVKRWGLSDHSYNVLVFSSAGNLLFNKASALSEGDIVNLTTMIW